MQKKMNRKEFIMYFGAIIIALIFVPKGLNELFETEKKEKYFEIIEE